MKTVLTFSAILMITALLAGQGRQELPGSSREQAGRVTTNPAPGPGNTAVISCQMEELTSPQFPKAVELAGGVCVIPIGIIEKHATHLPLGTDLYEARASVIRSAEKEYAVVFPPYYVGQIFEAKHQPGTIAYSNELMWKMLEETCQELSRNGLREKNALRAAKLDGHAGEEETSMMSFIRPDLVDAEALAEESGADQRRLAEMPNCFTGIHWYARFPNHYAGDLVRIDPKLGGLLIEKDARQLAALIHWLKNNNTVEQLQEEFFDRSKNPLIIRK